MSLGADWSTSHAHSFAVQLAYLQAEVNHQDEPFGTDFLQVCVCALIFRTSKPLPWGESQGLTHSTSNCVLFMFLSSFFIYSFAERACLVRSWKLGHSRGEDVELLTFDPSAKVWHVGYHHSTLWRHVRQRVCQISILWRSQHVLRLGPFVRAKKIGLNSDRQR